MPSSIPGRATSEVEYHDHTRELRKAIDLTGYYPDIVSEAVLAAVAGEEVVSYYVDHETTFERDEVRRHLTVVVLTPSRLVRAHTDEHPGDDLLPEPYTSTATEAILLASISSVVVTRIATQPKPTTSQVTPAVEAVLTIGWGGLSRIDLEPAGCSDPACEADHGYTGMLAPDDFSLRASEAADGESAVTRLLAFAEALSMRTRGA